MTFSELKKKDPQKYQQLEQKARQLGYIGPDQSLWDGRPGHPEWPSQWFSKFIKKHELPPLNFHGLRHTAATMLINEGLPAKTVSGRFGHAAIETTYADADNDWLQAWAKMDLLGTRPYGYARAAVMAAGRPAPTTAEEKQREAAAEAIAGYARGQASRTTSRGLTPEHERVAENIAAHARRLRQSAATNGTTTAAKGQSDEREAIAASIAEFVNRHRQRQQGRTGQTMAHFSARP